MELSIFLIFKRLKKNILMNRLIILTGPSCIGKSTLDKALKRFYPGLRENMQKLVLFNNRTPRPGEMEGVDYYFRKKEEIEAFRLDANYIVMGVRGDLQALNLKELSGMLKKNNVFFEGPRPHRAAAPRNWAPAHRRPRRIALEQGTKPSSR